MATLTQSTKLVVDNEHDDVALNPPTGPNYVADVMTPRVITVRESASFKEIVDALTSNRISAVPVVDEQRRVLGVVSESDLLARVFGGPVRRPRRSHRPHLRGSGHAGHTTIARDLMSAPAVVTSPRTTIADAAHLTAVARARRLPVVDSDRVLVGIVTRSDLLRPFLRPDSVIECDIENNVIVHTFNLDPVFGVSTRVTDGVAVLSGGHLEPPVGATLIDDVRQVSGVIDVDDRLTYRHDQPRWNAYDAMGGYCG